MSEETNRAEEAKKALIESWSTTENDNDFFGELIFQLKERGFVIQPKQYTQEQANKRDEYWKGVLKEEVIESHLDGQREGYCGSEHYNNESSLNYYEQEIAPKYK